MEPLEPKPTASRPIEVGRVLGEAFSQYRSHALPLILSALAVFIPIGALQVGILSAGGPAAQVVAGAVSLLGTSLFVGFVVRFVEDVRDGKRDFSVGELFASAYSSVTPLFLNGLLLAAGVVVGIVLFVVPGLYLLTIWAVCSPAIVAERRGAIEAFGRSRELVRGQGLPVFLSILSANLIGSGIWIVVSSIGAALGDVGVVLGSIIGLVLAAPITALVAATLFFDLRGGLRRDPEDSQVVIEY